jgi:GrpB-like predicted nucleotidyltransferase (UPF0157 family)
LRPGGIHEPFRDGDCDDSPPRGSLIMAQLVSDVTNSVLGLRLDKVRLRKHNRRWSLIYALTASEIVALTDIGVDRIEHVGSTSVPGLAAVPILDIAIGLQAHEVVDDIAAQLARVGYVDLGGEQGDLGRLLARESSPAVRTIHIFIVGYGTEAWHEFGAFRDGLKNNALVRSQYSDVKRALARRFSEDRESYRAAKNAFVRKTLDVISTGRVACDPK